MIDLEDEIRAALTREQPSSEFVARVMARTRAAEQPVLRWQPWAASIIAASLLAGSLGLETASMRRERKRRLEAREQVLQALAITSVKLRRVEKRLKGIDE